MNVFGILIEMQREDYKLFYHFYVINIDINTA
jgi:hypothetical protein